MELSEIYGFEDESLIRQPPVLPLTFGSLLFENTKSTSGNTSGPDIGTFSVIQFPDIGTVRIKFAGQ